MKIGIVDYGVGNVGSIQNMLRRVGASSVLCSTPEGILESSHIVLPGVGSFDSAMSSLRKSGLLEAIEVRVRQHKAPILGICVGMQMLCEGSDEGGAPGLGWIRGHCRRFESVPGLRVPHMGWNYVKPEKPHSICEGISDQSRFYFVHSYHLIDADPGDVLFTTEYGSRFVSGVQRDNLIGVQFHPEKSHRFGLRLLARFVTN